METSEVFLETGSCSSVTREMDSTGGRAWVQFLTMYKKGPSAMPKKQSLSEYFYSRIRKSGACWEWIGPGDKSMGYGTCSDYQEPSRKAHRLSWVLHHGAIPAELFVLHSCDNRICVNPSHLWLGTQKDNQQDAVRKNRSSRGERNGMAVLTADSVRELRARYTGQRGELKLFASEYGITSQAIKFAVSGRNWAWVK